jgi:hypothetical protein
MAIEWRFTPINLFSNTVSISPTLVLGVREKIGESTGIATFTDLTAMACVCGTQDVLQSKSYGNFSDF